MSDFKTILLDCLPRTALSLTAEQVEKLCAFDALLEETNRSMNLISSVDAEERVTRHYLDSLASPAVARLASARSAIDVGTGAGFPGVPLAILLGNVSFTLLDSTRKKTDFLLTACETLELKNVTILNARAEDAVRTGLRERFDAALSRAVASLPVLLEYTLPFVRIGGRALAWKGPAAQEEMAASIRAASVLGSAELLAHPYSISGHSDFFVVEAKKIRPTPPQYPRKVGVPLKSPIK